MAAIFEPAGPSGAGRPAWVRPKHLLFAALAAMYLYVILKFESFLVDPKDPEWAHIQPFKWLLLPHALAAACALVLGPLQFSDRLRARLTKLHHVLGYTYITGCLIGAPMGAYVQWTEERLGNYGRSFTVATVFDALLWMAATLTALYFIRARKMQLHRQWMTRSFACALIFVEVRLVMGLFNWEQYAEMIVWTCVACAYPLADFTLLIQDGLRKRIAKI
jgi:uncharacterized membrane protein